MILKEVVDNVEGSRDNEVVVVDEGDKVDEEGEEWVDGIFVGETQRELGLRADLHKSDKNS